MAEALRFFRTYEVWIYLLLGLAGLFYLRRFILSWGELRGAGFGLERDSAQARLNQAASVLVLLLTMVVMEFVLVSYIAPSVPGAVPLLTPTLDLLATPTTTLPASPGTGGTPAPVVLGTNMPPGVGLTGTPPAEGQAAAATPAGNNCVPDQISIGSPKEGDEIRGSIEISGTVDIPNFGFYKFEMKPQESTDWLTILAGNEAKKNGTLGTWNTSLLSPGNYQLGLVVTDNQGKVLPACVIDVRVAPPIVTQQP
jgi:hypothetical protein